MTFSMFNKRMLAVRPDSFTPKGRKLLWQYLAVNDLPMDDIIGVVCSFYQVTKSGIDNPNNIVAGGGRTYIMSV